MSEPKAPSTLKLVPRTITVMLGGQSAEREVSLRTGISVARTLRSLGHRVLELDPQSDDWTIPPGTELVFLALHGTYGEDGTVQGKLDGLGIPYTGCDARSSRLAFDKALTKEAFAQAGIPTPRYQIVESASCPWPAPETLTPPLVLKPCRQGSSVGLQFVSQTSEWAPALEKALEFDRQILVEEQIAGREVTVALLADQVLPIVEIRPLRGPYNYENKYTKGATQYLCPAPFPEAITRAIQTCAQRAFEAIGGRDYGRVDLMVPARGEAQVLEINTLPGMTETSLFPKAAVAAGLDYAALCQRMIDLALRHDATPPRP